MTMIPSCVLLFPKELLAVIVYWTDEIWNAVGVPQIVPLLEPKDNPIPVREGEMLQLLVDVPVLFGLNEVMLVPLVNV